MQILLVMSSRNKMKHSILASHDVSKIFHSLYFSALEINAHHQKFGEFQ